MRLFLIAGFVALTLFAYQNCSQTLKGQNPDGSENKSEEVIGNGADYTKLVYDPYLEGSYPNAPASKKLEVDTQSGVMKLSSSSATAKTCTVDTARLDQLRDVLSKAQICKPGPLPDNTAVCMALALADIELSNAANAKIQLRPLMCNNGTFLCAGLDDVLRGLLGELRDNPPVSCQ